MRESIILFYSLALLHMTARSAHSWNSYLRLFQACIAHVMSSRPSCTCNMDKDIKICNCSMLHNMWRCNCFKLSHARHEWEITVLCWYPYCGYQRNRVVQVLHLTYTNYYISHWVIEIFEYIMAKICGIDAIHVQVNYNLINIFWLCRIYFAVSFVAEVKTCLHLECQSTHRCVGNI